MGLVGMKCLALVENQIVIDIDRVIEAVQQDDLIGFCTTCGEEFHGYEPDARACECEMCGQFSVYGAEELLLF